MWGLIRKARFIDSEAVGKLAEAVMVCGSSSGNVLVATVLKKNNAGPLARSHSHELANASEINTNGGDDLHAFLRANLRRRTFFARIELSRAYFSSSGIKFNATLYPKASRDL